MSEIPFVDGSFFLGSALEFQRDPLAFLKKHEARHPDLFRFRVGGNTLYFTNNAEFVQHILLKNFKNYGKQNLMYREMAILFGEATSVVDGEKWERGNELIKPSLAMKRVAEFSGIIEESFAALLEDWQARASRGETVEATKDLADTTMNIIVGTMFGSSIAGQEALISSSFANILEIIVSRILSVVKAPLAVPTPQNLRYRRSIRNIDQLIYRLIDEKLARRGSPTEGFRDILGEWVERLGDKAPESKRRLRDEVIGLFVAGHGSSATFLSWILYHLATQSAVQEQVAAELASVLGGRIPKAEEMPQLVFTRAVIEESMRITPPGWAISRSTIGEDQLGPYHLPPRSMVLISPYLLHHSPRYWKDPETFDPGRFLAKGGGGYPANAFVPFTTGPRVCTGKSMALVEATLLVAMLVPRIRLELAAGHVVTPKGGFTLGLHGGLKLRLTARSPNTSY